MGKKVPMNGQYHKVTSTNIAIDSIIVIILSTTAKNFFLDAILFCLFIHCTRLFAQCAQLMTKTTRNDGWKKTRKTTKKNTSK